MSVDPSKINRLTDEHRFFIKYKLSEGFTPQEIIKSWNVGIHKRAAPSIQKIYKIKELVDGGHSVEAKKSGPKRRSVLTDDKLMEIKNTIEGNRFLTNNSLAQLVTLPKSTVHDGLKILQLRKFKAVPTTGLTERHKEQRLFFYTRFLCWNVHHQLKVWWSDESTFKVEELLNYVDLSYYADENLHLKIEKQKRQPSVNVWAAIRGDGKVVYEILEGNQNTETYVRMLTNKLPEMEPLTSFLM